MNKELINKKLNQLELYLKELQTLILSHSKEAIKKDPLLLRTAERLTQLLVDTMIDINIHILLSEDKVYDQSRSTFILLGEMGILPMALAKKIAPIVGLRNILVHRYETLDKDLFVRNLFKNKDDFKHYLVAIYDFLEKIKEEKL
jgi:uncharacterized protein YutE (UPF0331/DUF86 family)